MMQVYEYFISHYLSKAFESLFGAVTCLPGCFSMYRIRTLEGKPLIVNDAIIEGYGLNRVDTLHLKVGIAYSMSWTWLTEADAELALSWRGPLPHDAHDEGQYRLPQTG